MWTDFIITILTSGLISALIILILQNRYYKNQEKKRNKFEIFKQLMGNRNALTDNYEPENKIRFFEALNTAFVVFSDNENVLRALNNFHTQPNNAINTSTELFNEICKDLGIEIEFLGDEFFQRPLSRN